MIMTDAEENEIRQIVREEIIGILEDSQSALGVTKDPTGMGKKALDGMISLIRKRGDSSADSN